MKAKQIDDVKVHFFKIPTVSPSECDGTLCWDSTGLLVVEVQTQDFLGVGYTYTDEAAKALVKTRFAPLLKSNDPSHIQKAMQVLFVEARNIGHQGIVAAALSALDIALWDLKAKLLQIPLSDLLGRHSEKILGYWSGGFTSYSTQDFEKEWSTAKDLGFECYKMKVGSHPMQDEDRVKIARSLLAPTDKLFVDANGAYSTRQAIALAEQFYKQNVSWFEEPVASDNKEGLKFVRAHLPGEMELAAGEYGWDKFHFASLIQNQCVDVLQIDVTRCGGISNFLKISALAETFHIPISCHTAPYLHIDVACAVPNMRHIEVFKDHKIIEESYFDKASQFDNGYFTPNKTLPGHGLKLRWSEIKAFAAE